MRLFKICFALFLLVLTFGCASSGSVEPVPPQANLPEISEAYSIGQATSTMISISAPNDEEITVYLYEPDGSLGLTLYEGSGGIMVFSLVMVANDQNYTLRSGPNTIVLIGPQGRAEYVVSI